MSLIRAILNAVLLSGVIQASMGARRVLHGEISAKQHQHAERQEEFPPKHVEEGKKMQTSAEGDTMQPVEASLVEDVSRFHSNAVQASFVNATGNLPIRYTFMGNGNCRTSGNPFPTTTETTHESEASCKAKCDNSNTCGFYSYCAPNNAPPDTWGYCIGNCKLYDRSLPIIGGTQTEFTGVGNCQRKQGSYEFKGNGGCAWDGMTYPVTILDTSGESQASCMARCDRDSNCGFYSYCAPNGNCNGNCALYTKLHPITGGNQYPGAECFKKSVVTEGSWHPLKCNYAGKVSFMVTETTSSTGSVSSTTTVQLGTEIKAGVIFESASVSASVSEALALSWSSTNGHSEATTVDCQWNQDLTEFRGGCLFQWHMTIGAGLMSWDWASPFVTCTKGPMPRCAPEMWLSADDKCHDPCPPYTTRQADGTCKKNY